MTPSRRMHHLAFALLLCLAAAACTADGQPGGQEQTAAGQPSGQDPAGSGGQDPGGGSGGQASSGGSGGAPGAPSNRRNGARAKAAPIKLPAFQAIGNAFVDKQKAEIEAEIRKRCKPVGELCVKTVVKAREGYGLHDCFAGTDPPTNTAGTELQPGEDVLVIYSGPGVGECQTTEPTEPTDPTEPTEPTEPTDPTEPTEDSQPPSTS
jgi:hypothetical protein